MKHARRILLALALGSLPTSLSAQNESIIVEAESRIALTINGGGRVRAP